MLSKKKKKREKHIIFILVRYTNTPSLSSFFSASKTRHHLLQNFRNSPSNERDHSNLDIENLSFSFFFLPLLPSFFSSFSLLFLEMKSPSFYIFIHPSIIWPSIFFTLILGILSISLEITQSHEFPSFHEVSRLPILNLPCLTTKNPYGLKLGSKKPTKWPKTEPKP